MMAEKETLKGICEEAIEVLRRENEERQRLLRESEEMYDPLKGIGSVGYGAKEGPWRRRRVCEDVLTEGRVEYVPESMYKSREYRALRKKAAEEGGRIYSRLKAEALRTKNSFATEEEGESETETKGKEAIITRARVITKQEMRREWVRLRCREDFEYWAAVCVRIKDKSSPRLVPFRLNRPQRRVLGIMERQRLRGEPIRLIMLKARQWGGSTLVQMYMAWLQCTRLKNWHSLICAHVARGAATIRGMYNTMLTHYPRELWEGDAAPRLARYEGQDQMREIAGRDCRISLGSSEKQDAIRGGDYAMAHLTEVAFWKDTPKSTPADYVRAICGGIGDGPNTLIVYESTANGMGNFFHSEWKRSERGESDKTAVFVPWHEIEIYRTPVKNVRRLWESMDEYEQGLWEQGVTLEAINWYHRKRREYADHKSMQAEYPSNPTEAFANTGTNVFSTEAVGRLCEGCRSPEATGEAVAASGAVIGPESLRAVRFVSDSKGGLKLWERPEAEGRYVVAVDVGGRSRDSDWSVIAVLRAGDGKPRVAAQWRGHTDHDLLTWKAAAIATYYNRALLVFESNTLETEAPDQGEYILHELYEHYANLYRRGPDPDGGGGGWRVGFHTNRATKQMIVTELIAAVRDGLYEERDAEACAELNVYELQPNGSYGARRGKHDDILMTRAIGLHAIREEEQMQRYDIEVLEFYNG